MAQDVIILPGRQVNLLEALLTVRYREATLKYGYVYGMLGFANLGDSITLPVYKGHSMTHISKLLA
jgi:hypothetical protein